MPEIPGVVCGQCLIPMGVTKNEVTLQALNDGNPYYKVHTDLWKCPKCKREIYMGFGRKPIAEHYQPEYGKIGFDKSFKMIDSRWYDAEVCEEDL